MIVWVAGGGTGGHLYPGLAVARALRRLEPDARPLFVGARRGVERDILPASGFQFLLLDLHPIYRTRPWSNWRTLTGGARAWRALGREMHHARPDVVLGTGGYASGAALGYAASHGVRIALQEQNSFPGVTTRIFSRFASEVYLGYGEAARRLHARPGAWVGETGNPIDPPPSPLPDRRAARARWGFPPTGAAVLLIVGGSQGARAINEAVAAWVRSGGSDAPYVIWATGRAAHARFASLDDPRVRVVPYLSPIAEAYAAADVALTRAGALTLAELCAWGIPAVLVPLPTAAADHQTANARVLSGAGAAVQIAERELTGERLARELHALLDSPARLEQMARASRARARPGAAEEIARRILALGRTRS